MRPWSGSGHKFVCMTTVSGHTPLRLTAAAGAAAATALGDGTTEAAAAAEGEAAGLAAAEGEAAAAAAGAAGASVVGDGVGAAEVQPAAITTSARTGSVELRLNQRERCMRYPFWENF